MVKLQMDKGTDSIGHGPTNYVVNPYDWTVHVPPHVAEILLRTGTGAVVLSDDPEEEEFAAMRNTSNLLQPFAFRGQTFHPEDGRIHVPLIAVAAALKAGFTLTEES